MKKKKAVIAVSVVVLVAMAAGTIVVPRFVNARGNEVTVSATPVRTGDLSNHISLTGTVASSNVYYVYPELNSTITAIHVSVGDVVTMGQLLCELDSVEIKKSIEEQMATMSQSAQTSYNQIRESERIYYDALSNIENSTNSQINNAKNSLNNAEIELASRQRAYDERLAEFNEGDPSRIANAEKNITAAERELEIKMQTYEENVELYSVDAISRAELDSSRRAVETAQETYDEAVEALEEAKEEIVNELQTALDNAQEALDNAIVARDNAITSLETANVSAQQELGRYQQNVESALLSGNNDSQVYAMQRLERQLSQAQIKAPAAGTITAVFAKLGTTANGLLFMIEDTDSLKITTSIKEYDLSNARLGLMATIESDATGDNSYEGKLTFIAPTSRKDSTGATVSSSDVDFEAEISVITNPTELRVGSNARVDLIYEQTKGVMYVPVETVAVGMDGVNYVYALTPIEAMPTDNGEGGTTDRQMRGDMPRVGIQGMLSERLETIRERGADAEQELEYEVVRIEVITGIETDLYLEVSGQGLRQGMMIVNNPALVNEGDVVKIGLSNSGFGGAATGAPMGAGPSMRIGGGGR